MTTMTSFKTISVDYPVAPHAELDLSESERDLMNATTRGAYIEQIDEILQPYGAQVLGNGEIIVEVAKHADLSDAWELELSEIVGMIELDESIYSKFVR